MKAVKTVLAVAACAAASVAVYAAVAFDASTGAGFVGKGDIQNKYGWNNKQLNDNAASIGFRMSVGSVVSTTWTCDKDTGPQTQERNNTTTISSQGVVSHIARDNKRQITGFILTGYDGGPLPKSAKAMDLRWAPAPQAGRRSTSKLAKRWSPAAAWK